MPFIGIPPFGQTVRTVTTITATASQTSFTPTGGYTVGYCDVFYNGIKLVAGTDFTATDGLTVVLTAGATSGAVVEIITYGTVTITDAVRRSGDTFSGDVAFSTNTSHTGAATFANTVTVTGAVTLSNTINTINVTGTANVAQGLTANTLTVTTNTATIGTAVYVDSGGRVGIGGTPNTSYSGAKVLAMGSSGATILNKSGSNLELTQNGIWNGSGWTYLNTSNAALYQLTGGNHTFYSANSGSAGASVTWNTVMNIGGGGYSIALQGATPQTGTGISFPATQSASSDANTLDDYEEGTWTPALTASSSAPTVGYNVQTGYYTKIGRIVHVAGRIQINSISGGSGNIKITGLPFSNVIGITGASAAWISGLAYSGSQTWAQPYFEGNVNYLSMASSMSGTGQGATQLTIGSVGTIFDMSFSFTYITS